MCLYNTALKSFRFVIHRRWCSLETLESALFWNRPKLSAHFVGSVQALTKHHVHCFVAGGVQFFEDFRARLFEQSRSTLLVAILSFSWQVSGRNNQCHKFASQRAAGHMIRGRVYDVEWP